MTLGSHEPLQGPHEGTGVPFVAAGEAVRHLGVPLVRGDAQPAVDRVFFLPVDRVFASKLQAARATVGRWSRYGLGLKGRAHVAKQELASIVSLFFFHLGYMGFAQSDDSWVWRATPVHSVLSCHPTTDATAAPAAVADRHQGVCAA
jgi:hypothetical protein